MLLASVQFMVWDKTRYFDPRDLKVAVNDLVVVTTEFGLEIGRVIELVDSATAGSTEAAGHEEILPIDRAAMAEDLEIMAQHNDYQRKVEVLNYCRRVIKNHKLEMKLVDCYFSFDDRRLVLAFIADGRVDFRDLVKELTRYFQKSIRLHQVGVRDEAKIAGDIGSCGLSLCCQGHLKKLGNVSSDLAEQQQVAHRGSERLSGICGRLKCCLAYEKELYEELSKKLPAIGSRLKTKHGAGQVIGWHVLKGTVNVRLQAEREGDKEVVVEVAV